MKIAYLINQYPQSSQSFIRREIAALEGLGLQVDRFTIRRWDQALVDEGDRAEAARTRAVLEVGPLGLLKATMRVVLTRPGKFWQALKMAMRMGRHADRGLAYHLIYLAEACVLAGWFAGTGAQHVHAHFGTNSTTVAMLCRLLGGPPYSFTAHGPEEFDKPQFIWLGEKIRHAAFAVTVSEYGRSQMYRWCGHEDWQKVHVIHCGLDAAFLSPASGDAQQPDDAPDEVPDVARLVCVGRLAEQKGQLLLVDAAARLAREGMKFELVLAGDGPMRGDVEKAIGLHGLGEMVRITGWVSNVRVRREILLSRAMILPSFAEGLPVVIMEALALRRPVISTYVAGIPELVEHGVCGLLVPAGSIDALAEAMREILLMDVQRLHDMGKEGARRVALHHTAAGEAARLAELFQQSAMLPQIAPSTRPHTELVPPGA